MGSGLTPFLYMSCIIPHYSMFCDDPETNLGADADQLHAWVSEYCDQDKQP